MLTALILSTNLLLTPAIESSLANAIYIAEGGVKTKYPYGIKSVHTTNPRQVCITTIEHTYKLWTRKTNFIDFLADTYCPVSCDPVGNLNWKRNIRKLIK